MDAFAAVHLLAGLEVRYAWAGSVGQAFVVVVDVVASKGDVGGVDDKGAFEVCIFKGEAAHKNIVEAGIVEAVDEDAVG